MAYGTLTIIHVDGRREPLTIEKPTIRIGRDRSNDVVLGDVAVEGFHAEILADPTGLQILDLGSANGTEVDGQRILGMPQPLADGSVIRIGGARIVVAVGGRQGPAVTRVIPVLQTEGLLESLLANQPAAARRQETQPIPAAPPPPPARLMLTMRPADVTVQPGQSTLVAVELLNRGGQEELVRFAVDGVYEWAALDVDQLPIPPGGRVETQIYLAPPRAPESRAGSYEFTLRATPERLPESAVTAVGRLNVAAFTDFRFRIRDPRARTGWRGGRYTAEIHNAGNLPMPFTLAGSDPQAAMSYRFRPEPVLVEPGETRRSELRASLGFRRLLMPAQSYPFVVTAAPADDSAPPQQASANFLQRSTVPPWVLIALIWLLALSLLLLAVGLGVRQVNAYLASRPTPTATPLPATPTLAIPSPEPSPTAEVLPTIEAIPVPQVIVPTVIVNVQPAPAPAPVVVPPVVVPPVTVPVVQTPAPVPPDRVASFAKLRGNDVGQRSPIVGDEYADQQLTFCIYREVPLPAPPGPTPIPNDPPQTVDGLTLSVSDDPDPATVGGPLTIRADISNSLSTRRFFQAALTARPPAGAKFAQPSDSRCVVQPDGSVVCNFPDLGDDNAESFSLPLATTQAGPAAVELELVALAGDTADAPARTLSVKARTNTAVLAGPAPVADCGALGSPLVQESLAARSPQSFMFQVPPVLYPPGGNLQLPLHALTSDTGPEQFAGDAIAAIAFQRPAVEVAVTIYFPGPAGNFVALYGLDEQGKLISTSRTDRLSVPGLYQLVLKGLDRPIRLALLQNAANEGPGPIAVSSGGIFITRVEANNTAR